MAAKPTEFFSDSVKWPPKRWVFQTARLHDGAGPAHDARKCETALPVHARRPDRIPFGLGELVEHDRLHFQVARQRRMSFAAMTSRVTPMPLRSPIVIGPAPRARSSPTSALSVSMWVDPGVGSPLLKLGLMKRSLPLKPAGSSSAIARLTPSAWLAATTNATRARGAAAKVVTALKIEDVDASRAGGGGLSQERAPIHGALLVNDCGVAAVSTPGMDTLLQDIRFGWRLLRRTPGFTIAAVLALALGVGATTAIFSVLDRVVLRPLPYSDPDRLLMVWETNDAKGLAHERLSPVNFGDYRNLTQVFDDAAAWWYPAAQPDRNRTRSVAGECNRGERQLLQSHRRRPGARIRFPPDTIYSREAIAVISHRLWRDRFNADPGIIGKTVALNGPAYTIVGVMPDGFNYPGQTDVWQRLTWDMTQHSRGAHFMESLFRLKPGAPLDQANAELRALTRRLGDQFEATNGDWHARAVRCLRKSSGSSGRRCSRCSEPRRSCSSSPAPTWRACCSPARPCGSARWRFAPRLAPAAAVWCGSS